MWGVFCEYFNECGHYILRYVTVLESEAREWAAKTEGINTFCKVRELLPGDFEEIYNFDED